MPGTQFRVGKQSQEEYDADQSSMMKELARLRKLIEPLLNNANNMASTSNGRSTYTPPTVGVTPGVSSTTIINRTDSGSSGTVGPAGPAGPSDRMSDAAILITTTPYDINPTDAKPQAYIVNVGATGSACVVNIHVGMNSAGKKILLINGQRGGHSNKVAVTCDQGTGSALTDPLNYGGDSLDAVIVAIPTGNTLVASGASTSNSGTTSTSDGTSTGTPIAVQLRVQVMGIYHAEAATTGANVTPVYNSGEMIASGLGTGTDTGG